MILSRQNQRFSRQIKDPRDRSADSPHFQGRVDLGGTGKAELELVQHERRRDRCSLGGRPDHTFLDHTESEIRILVEQRIDEQSLA